MNTRNEISRVTVDLPKKMHRRLKARAAVLGKSMKEVILDALEATEECFCSDHIPNKKTLRAIKNAEEGRALVEVKNLKELFKKLDI